MTIETLSYENKQDHRKPRGWTMLVVATSVWSALLTTFCVMLMVEDEKGPNIGSGVATVMILFIGLPSVIAGCIVVGVHWPRLSALWRCLGVAIPLLLLIALGLRLILASLNSLPKSIAW